MRSIRFAPLLHYSQGYTVTTFTARPDYAAAFAEASTGGLLKAGLSPVSGFGRFLLVILAFSMVANNVPMIYSFALTAQVRSFVCVVLFGPRCWKSE